MGAKTQLTIAGIAMIDGKNAGWQPALRSSSDCEIVGIPTIGLSALFKQSLSAPPTAVARPGLANRAPISD